MVVTQTVFMKHFDGKLSFECRFCILNFDSHVERSEHIKGHFKWKFCAICDKSLIQIGDNWFELQPHIDNNCTPNDSKTAEGHDIHSSVQHIKVEENCLAHEQNEPIQIPICELIEIDDYKITKQEENISKEINDAEEEKEEEINTDFGDTIIDETCSLYEQNDQNLIDNSVIVNENNAKPSEQQSAGEKTLTCKYCQKVLNARYYKQHLQRKHNYVPTFTCEICSYTCTMRKDYNSHVTDMHGGYAAICTVCNKLFKKKCFLTSHMAIHGIGQEVACHICNKRFMQGRYLKDHMKIHKNHTATNIPNELDAVPEPVTVFKNTLILPRCEICNETFVTRMLYCKHIREIHDGIRRRCEICGKTFRTNCNFESHVITHKDGIYGECDYCKRSFKRKKSLIAHMKVHTEAENFKCKECGKYLLGRASLKIHTKFVHSKNRSFKCDVCGKCFKTPSNLKAHTARHSESKRFICSYCGQSLNTKCSLLEHINIHTGERPYTCGTCNKSFTHRCLLSAHIRVHTREKPNKCNVGDCDRAFINYTDMVRHKFSAHGVYTKQHICEICSAVFPEKKKLRKHMETH